MALISCVMLSVWQDNCQSGKGSGRMPARHEALNGVIDGLTVQRDYPAACFLAARVARLVGIKTETMFPA